MMTAAEYGRRIGVAKSRMSAFFGKGMPFSEGKDGHGRLCKFVDPAVADAWRAANLEPKIDGQGIVRGLVEAPSAPPREVADEKPRAPSPGEPSPPAAAPTNDSAQRIQAARAESQELDLEYRRNRLMTQQGQLVDRTAATGVLGEFAGAIGMLIDRMPADAATVLASSLGGTEHQAYLALQVVADRLREDLERQCRTSAERVRALGRG